MCIVTPHSQSCGRGIISVCVRHERTTSGRGEGIQASSGLMSKPKTRRRGEGTQVLNGNTKDTSIIPLRSLYCVISSR